MLKNIKSSYFIKLLFSFLDEGEKLDLIKYNKCLQKNIDISILNYKCFKKKYIKYKSKGIGKEYNISSGEVIYEGEYLNGKRNGKGKEYDYNGNLKFEGEYLNGKKQGKGKEYSSKILIFEGEFLNGKRNGKGKDFLFGTLLFEGEYLNGKRHGKGKEYFFNDKLKFEGEYSNGQEIVGIGYDINGNIVYKLNFIEGKIKRYNKNGEFVSEDLYLNIEKKNKKKYIILLVI